MAYFCLKCFNKIEGTNFTYDDVDCDLDICENCKENKPCVAIIKNIESETLNSLDI